MENTCSKCKWFRFSPHSVIAPIENMKADGICENENHKDQPVVLDSNEDHCEIFENKK